MVKEALSNLQAPDRKINVGGAMTALFTVIAWSLSEFAHIVVPAEVGIAAAGFFAYIVQYFVPNN